MNYCQKYRHWCESKQTDEATKQELAQIAGNEAEIKERFFCELAFGTGGLRGLIGAGTNRINKYIVRKTTKGYAEYIKKNGKEACHRGVVIAHDNRRFSIEFAQETACVLAKNGIKAYLFDSLRPTPELSFAVRELHAFGGVVITASHNPPEYNGYKLYDERGCQLVTEVNDLVVSEIAKIEDPLSVEVCSVEEAKKKDLIVILPSELDEIYYKAVLSLSLQTNLDKTGIKIVYSPQHGTGNIPVRTVLDRLGYCVIPVEEQCAPDTEFSKTLNPNPETAEAYVLALEYAKKYDADLVITTDPDCDRLGVAVKHGGDYIRMTGNQSAAILLEYILSQRTALGTLPKNAVMFNTVVTSDLGDRICADYGVSVEKTLTGFKYIGDKIYRHECLGDKTFVFGYEESYGCLISDCVRDKDAVQASMMLCEAAAYYNSKKKTLIDVLEDLYARYGFFLDALDNFTFKGLDGADKITSLVNDLRKEPPATVGEYEVVAMEDYQSQKMQDVGFPSSNVLRFLIKDGSWVAVRPSGTEPKCKFYFSVNAKTRSEAEAKLSTMRKVFEKNC
ncbi:MAG: phospho-sugar mutase [Ruminococcaceae bacterium]|nr:phospho-sugar mutase [Oscillospiraceae bacterium]